MSAVLVGFLLPVSSAGGLLAPCQQCWWASSSEYGHVLAAARQGRGCGGPSKGQVGQEGTALLAFRGLVC